MSGRNQNQVKERRQGTKKDNRLLREAENDKDRGGGANLNIRPIFGNLEQPDV